MDKTTTPEGNGQPELSTTDRLGAFIDDDDTSPETAGQEAQDSEDLDEGEPAGEDPEDHDEDEGGAEPEEGDADEEEAEDSEPPEPDDRAMVDLKGQKVSIKELKAGYFRQADYTQKTQALAEQRRQVEAVTAEVLRERQSALEALAAAQNYMQQAMPQEPNWQQLYMENPQEYAIQREAWRSMKEQQQAMQARQAQLMQQAQQQQARQQQEFLQQELGKLLEALPSWNKDEVRAKEQERIVTWGQKQGYSREELASITDHRALLIARKAMLYDEMLARKASLKPSPTKTRGVAVPGAAQTGRASSREREARQRFAKSGSARDAADLMLGFIED